jgi:hypothetical protein
MTPEEKAKERYPYNPLDGIYMKWFLKGGRNGFIEGANWMAEEKDKEIEYWKSTLRSIKHRINEHYGGGFTDEDIALAHYKHKCGEYEVEIAALKAEIERLNEFLKPVINPINPPR